MILPFKSNLCFFIIIFFFKFNNIYDINYNKNNNIFNIDNINYNKNNNIFNINNINYNKNNNIFNTNNNIKSCARAAMCWL